DNKTVLITKVKKKPFSVIQQKTIVGRITDSENNGLAGVSIHVKNTQISTVSNQTGNYSINVPASGALLEFSYLGFTPQEIKISNQTVLNVVLQSSTTSLQDVVVIG